MTEKLQNNPETKEKQEEKIKNISSFLKEAKSIYLSWKEADKTYNKNGITNMDVRKKYLYFKEKWENIKIKYDNTLKFSKFQKDKLVKEIKNMKKENRKYESLLTIANIFYYLQKENKDGRLDKVLQNLNIAKNIREIINSPKKIETLQKKLKEKTGKIPNGENNFNYITSDKNKKLSKEEKILYSYLDSIKYFHHYAEQGGVKLDLNKDNNIFEKELKNFEKLDKKYNSQNKDNDEKLKNQKTQENYDKTNNLSDNYIKLDNLIYNSNSSIITIKNKTGIKTIKVSEYDKKILREDNVENYLKLHETFEKAGISKLIPYLPQISSAIGGNVNYNDNFLKENELKQVLNAILSSTGYKTIDIKKDLNEFINIFSNIKNKKQYGGFKDNFYKKGSSPIEEKFIERFIKNKIKFPLELFKKLIKV